MSTRAVPLIVVASTSATLAENVAAGLRRDGNVVYVTHSAHGCLRVATSVSPDVIVLDATMPRQLVQLLRAHPASAGARVVSSSEVVARPRAAEPVPVLHAAA